MAATIANCLSAGSHVHQPDEYMPKFKWQQKRQSIQEMQAIVKGMVLAAGGTVS